MSPAIKNTIRAQIFEIPRDNFVGLSLSTSHSEHADRIKLNTVFTGMKDHAGKTNEMLDINITIKQSVAAIVRHCLGEKINFSLPILDTSYVIQHSKIYALLVYHRTMNRNFLSNNHIDKQCNIEACYNMIIVQASDTGSTDNDKEDTK